MKNKLKKAKPIFFELQGDEGDKERVMLNLIQAAESNSNLEVSENKEEIRCKGMIIVKANRRKK